jgi:hypothetical protein
MLKEGVAKAKVWKADFIEDSTGLYFVPLKTGLCPPAVPATVAKASS